MSRGWPTLVLVVLFGGQPAPAVAQLRVEEKNSIKLEVARQGGGVFSPDGKVFVVSAGEALWVYETATGKLIASRTAPRRKMFTFLHEPIFSPDGALLAYIGTDSTAIDGYVSLWDTKTWKQSAILRTPAPKLLAFSPDSRELAVRLQAKEGEAPISIWEVKGGNGVRERAVLRAPDGGNPVYSPDGKLLFTGSSFWNAETEEWRKFPGGKTFPEGVARFGHFSFSPDSKLFCAMSWDGNNKSTGFKFWDVTTGKEVATVELKANRPGQRTPIFSPDGKLLAVETSGGTELIDVGTGKSLATVGGSQLVFSRDGKSLTGFGKDGFTTWELTREQEPAK